MITPVTLLRPGEIHYLKGVVIILQPILNPFTKGQVTKQITNPKHFNESNLTAIKLGKKEES